MPHKFHLYLIYQITNFFICFYAFFKSDFIVLPLGSSTGPVYLPCFTSSRHLALQGNQVEFKLQINPEGHFKYGDGSCKGRLIIGHIQIQSRLENVTWKTERHTFDFQMFETMWLDPVVVCVVSTLFAYIAFLSGFQVLIMFVYKSIINHINSVIFLCTISL